MSETNVTNLIIAFVAALASAVLVAGWGALRRWKTRDKQLMKISTLVGVHQSDLLTDTERDELGRRIRFEVDDYLNGDSLRRAFRVQRILYGILGAFVMGLAYLGGRSEGVPRVGFFAGMALCMFLAVGITGVPPSRWAMPSFLKSYRDPTKFRGMTTAYAEWGAEDTKLKEGETVLIYRSGNGLDFDHLRGVVGDSGWVLGVEPKEYDRGWSENGVAMRGWKNVVVGDSLEDIHDECVDVAIVKNHVLKMDRAEIVSALSELRRVLRPGGRIMVFALGGVVARPRERPTEIHDLIGDMFEECEYADLGRMGLAIRAVKAIPEPSASP